MKINSAIKVLSLSFLTLAASLSSAQDNNGASRSELPAPEAKNEDPDKENSVGLSYIFSGATYNETLLESKLKVPNKDLSVLLEASTGSAVPSPELSYRFRYAKIGVENDGGSIGFAWTSAPGQFEQKGIDFGADFGPDNWVTHLSLGADQIFLQGNPKDSQSALSENGADDTDDTENEENQSAESRTQLANAFQNQKGQRFLLGLSTTVKTGSPFEIEIFGNTFTYEGALKTRNVEYSEISGDMASGLNKWDAGFGVILNFDKTKLRAKGTWAESQLDQEAVKFMTLGADYKVTPQFNLASEATVYERSQGWKVGTSYAW
jgi:hypothetical protein